MDKQEAREILEREIRRLRDCRYDALLKLRVVDARQVMGERTGTLYNIECEAFFDDPKSGNGHLRVVVAVDDGSFRAFVPLSESFIIAPDGSFVGK